MIDSTFPGACEADVAVKRSGPLRERLKRRRWAIIQARFDRLVQRRPVGFDQGFPAVDDERRITPYPMPEGDDESLQGLGIDQLDLNPVAISVEQIQDPVCQILSLTFEIGRVSCHLLPVDASADASLVKDLFAVQAMVELRQDWADHLHIYDGLDHITFTLERG
jgi:hypothetical protein